ncbi:MAG: hypothetical protein QOE51_1328 [Actinoplanes sp.]|nr:hypothetical protein [Actinoplanes sp.]
MRHVRSILYALVLAPAVWVLCGAGFTGDLIGRAHDSAGTVESLTGLMMLLLAGAAYAILIFSPISPAGPLLGGLVYLAAGLWSWAAPSSYASVWSPELSKDGFNLSLPGYGLALVLSVPMICTALSAQRWARYEPPVLPVIGALGRLWGSATVAGEPIAAAQTTVFRTQQPGTQVVERPAEDTTLLTTPPSARSASSTDSEATTLLATPPDSEATTLLAGAPSASSTDSEATTLLATSPDSEATTLLATAPDSEAATLLKLPADDNGDEATTLLKAPESEGDQATTLLPSAAAVEAALAKAATDGGERTQLIRPADADQTVDVRGERATEDARGERATEAVPVDQPPVDIHSDQATEAVPTDQPTADVRGEQPTEAVRLGEPTPEVRDGETTEAVSVDGPTIDVREEPAADEAPERRRIGEPVLVARGTPPAEEGPGEKTQVVPLVGERSTVDLGLRTRQSGTGEKTVVISRDPGEKTQVIRMPGATSPPLGETTREIRPTMGTVEPPGERTQVIRMPTAAVDPPVPNSVASAERPDPGADPTTRLNPQPRSAETTAEQRPAETTPARPMTVMNMERPPDEAQDDTRPLTIPTQRQPPED